MGFSCKPPFGRALMKIFSNQMNVNRTSLHIKLSRNPMNHYAGQLYRLVDHYLILVDGQQDHVIEYVAPSSASLTQMGGKLSQRWGRLDPKNPQTGVIDAPFNPAEPEVLVPVRQQCQFSNIDRS